MSALHGIIKGVYTKCSSFFFFFKFNVKRFKHLNVSSSYVGLISRQIKMAFAGILKDDDVAAALKECAGKTHLL